MEQSLSIRSTASHLGGSLIPSEHEMMVYHTMAEQAVSSKMYKGVGDKPGVMMIMLAARELGIAPMQALNGGLNIINGKVEMSAGLMSAMIRRAGHIIQTKEESPTKCTIYGKRADNGVEEEASFTIEEARQAGLIKPGGGWTKCPTDMLWARALSRLKRRLFSDIVSMAYVHGEISQAPELKSSACDVEDVVNTEEVEVENVTEYTAKFLEVFAEADKALALQYLEEVKKHFEWTTIVAIKMLLQDEKRLMTKFIAWKNKFTKVEVV